MNSLIAWWTKNSVAANLLMILILMAGLFGFMSVEREEFPSPAFNLVQVNFSWPGAGPRDVEEQMVVRFEEALADLDGVAGLVSNAFEGRGSIQVEMAEDGRDFNTFMQEVKNRVDAVNNLPQDSFPPTVSQLQFNQVLSYIVFASDLPDREHNALAREIRDEMAALPRGTPIVSLWGEQQEEVGIEVSEEALRRYDLTFSDIANAIRNSSINQSAGSVQTDSGSVALAIRNLADTKSEFERIVVRQNQDGSVITVGDVATVVDGFVESRFIRETDDLPAMTIAPRAPEVLNIVEISQAIQTYIDEKQDELPEGAVLSMSYDTVESYESQLGLVRNNALLGLALVLVVLTLFLRPAVAFWVAAGIAISFVGTFIFMPYVGISLNFLSLFALLLVIGIVVDDALIVGESIHRQTERGKSDLEAATIGAQMVSKPVLFAVLTTMIAFSPFLFISGGVAQFTRNIAWVVILALTFSLIESFLILPAHLAHLKKERRDGPIAKFQAFFADGILWIADRFYRPLIKTAIAIRWVTVMVFIGLFGTSYVMLQNGWVPFKFMPEVEGSYFEIDIEMQEGTPYDRNVQIYQHMKDAIDQTNRQYMDELDENILVSRRTYVTETAVGAGVIIVDGNDRSITLREFADRLRENIGDIPDAEEVTIDSSGGGGGNDGNEFFVSIEGDTLDALTTAADEVKDYLAGIGGLTDVRDSFTTPNDELQFRLTPGAERFGLTLAEVSRQVRQAYFGEEVQRLPREGRDVRVMVRYPRETRESLESLDNFRIRTADGREVPLAAVAEVSFAPALNSITRIDRKLSISVRANVAQGVDQSQIRREMNENFIPGWEQSNPGVSLKQRGSAEEEQEFFGRLIPLVLIALFCMYMLLAIAFGSYWQPIMIMSAIPFGFMGAVYGHAILGVPFAMFSVFGIAAAGGVVVNDNLVLIDYINRLRKEGAGAFQAIVESGTVRFRPIILTSVTTFIGLVPILYEPSVNAQFLKPMVVSLAFGVLFALFVTLVFVPALYAVGVDIARFYRSIWTGEAQPALGEGASASRDIPTIDPDDIQYQDGDEIIDIDKPSGDTAGGKSPGFA